MAFKTDSNSIPFPKATGYSFEADNAIEAVITDAELDTNVATITTEDPHGYTVGQTVVIALDPEDDNYDTFSFLEGSYVIATTPSSTTFTYSKTHADESSDTIAGTATESIASPIITGTTDIDLIVPDNAVSLVVYFVNHSAKLVKGAGSITIPAATLWSIPCVGGDTVSFTRATTTALEFYFETI